MHCTDSTEFLSLISSSTHSDLLPSRIQRDQSDVQPVQDTITSIFINPFEEMELISLSSGVIPTDKVTSDLLDAKKSYSDFKMSD